MCADILSFHVLPWSKARSTSRSLSETEQLVTRLELVGTNLGPAEEALAAARSLYASRRYSEAQVAAGRARTLAVRLNARFDAYMAAWKDAQACLTELRNDGLPAGPLEAALASANRRIAQLVEEDGARVPDYVGATAALERARAAARWQVDHARSADREIRAASLSLETLMTPRAAAVHSSLALRLERVLEEARRELVLGHAGTAYQIATEARLRADHALAGFARATALLDDTAGLLTPEDAEGEAAASDRAEPASASGERTDGPAEADTTVKTPRSKSVEVLGRASRFAHSLVFLEDVRRVYARLREVGFRSDDVEAALSEAGRALRAGDWSRVEEHAACAFRLLNPGHRTPKLPGFPEGAAAGADA